ncbi:MAG: hypothetical protein ACOC3V_03340 [bacterium]
MKDLKTAASGYALIIILAFLLTLLFASCESKSGKLHREADVKVVVIDSYAIGSAQQHKYKVKVIDDGTVGYIKSYYLFEENDTLLTKKSLILR